MTDARGTLAGDALGTPKPARETETVLAALRDITGRGQPAAVATVVHIWGSTYRRPGARMIVSRDGRTVGTISGGCLEPEIVELGSEVIETGRPLVVRYDLAEDTAWGLGIGCGGGLDLLIEPVPPDAWQQAQAIFRRWTADDQRDANVEGAPSPAAILIAGLLGLEEGRTQALVTLISAPGRLEPVDMGRPGAVVLDAIARVSVGETATSDGSIGGSLGDPQLTRVAAEEARRRLADSAARSWAVTLEQGAGRHRVFIELLRPAPTLLIFGGGHDAIPLARWAKGAGLRVVVVDPRPAYARRERFPEADDVVHGEGAEVMARLSPRASDYIVIMHHNKQRDRETLAAALETPVQYIGMLGPRRRTREILDELGIEAMPGQIRAPVGLDLGSETPDQVALSIVAEILAHRNHRQGGPLTLRDGSIH